MPLEQCLDEEARLGSWLEVTIILQPFLPRERVAAREDLFSPSVMSMVTVFSVGVRGCFVDRVSVLFQRRCKKKKYLPPARSLAQGAKDAPVKWLCLHCVNFTGQAR